MGRQRIRRHVASDIEEDEVLQNGTAEEQEDEEVEVKSQTARKEKGRGKEKASEKRTRVEEDQSDGQDEEEVTEAESDDDAARVDVTNFKDQPLSRVEAGKLYGLSTDWKEMDKRMQQSWSGVRQVAVALAGTAEDEGEKVCNCQPFVPHVLTVSLVSGGARQNHEGTHRCFCRNECTRTSP